MRKLPDYQNRQSILCLLLTFIPLSLLATISTSDTLIAEQYVLQAEKAKGDSISFYYKKAVDLYAHIAAEHSDTSLWNRYLDVGNLYGELIVDEKQMLDFFEEQRALVIKKFGSTASQEADVYHHLGIGWTRKRKFDKAIINYDKAVDFSNSIGYRKGALRSKFRKGRILRFRSQYNQALPEFYKVYELVKAEFGNKSKQAIDVIKQIAMTNYNKGAYDTAIIYFDTLLQVSLLQDSIILKDVAMGHHMKGNIHFKQSNYDTAIVYYEKTRGVYLQDSTRFVADIASCMGNTGSCHFQKGNFEIASKLFLESLALKEELLGENSVNLTYTYYNVGDFYYQQGDYQNALAYFSKSIRLLKEHYGEQASDLAFVYTTLGAVHGEMGEWEKAMNYLEKSIAIRASTGNLKHPDIAKDYDKIGEIQLESGQPALARAAIEKAIEIREEVLQANHPLLAGSYTNLAMVEMEQKDYNLAAALLNKALEIQTNQLERHHPSIANTYLQLAESAKLQNDYSKALDFIQTAIIGLVPSFESRNVTQNPKVTANFRAKTTLLNLLYQKGLLLKESYLQSPTDQAPALANAFNTFETASDLAEQIRKGYLSRFSKSVFLKKANRINTALIELAFLMHEQNSEEMDIAGVFQQIEKSKSILLLESVNDERAKQFAGIPREVLAKEQTMKKQIAFLENQLNNLKDKDTKVKDLEEVLFEKRVTYQKLVQSFEQAYPTYYQLKFQESVVDLAEVRAYLPNDESAILNYVWSDSTIYVMAIGKEQTLLHKIPIRATFIQQLSDIQTFLQVVPSDLSAAKQHADRQQFIENSHVLYQKLLAPLLNQMPKVSQLTIIPDGQLSYLPFGVLLMDLPTPPYDGYDQLKYSIGQYSFHYEYNSTLLLQQEKQLNSTNPEQLFAGFAPVYKANQPIALMEEGTRSSFELLPASTTFAPLKFNGEEVSTISKALAGKAFLGLAAGEDAFKAEAGRYKILHMAMHGFVNDEDPNLSYLAFSDTPSDQEDRFLYAFELYNMRLNADLAVLSACETGAGKLQKGEGVMSLSRAFKYAGIPNIVMSLWKADDLSTKNMMTSFYGYLKSGSGKSQALQQVKLDQIKQARDNKMAAHPFYWANFILVGNPQAIDFSIPFSFNQYVGIGVVVLLLGVFGWYLSKKQKKAKA